MKFIISIYLLFGLSATPAFADDASKIIGVWAEPNHKNADTLWYFYSDGKVAVSSNAWFTDLTWDFTDPVLQMTTESPRKHTWKASAHKKNIKGEHTFIFDKQLEKRKWSAEKISSNPDDLINFYALCSNTNNTWEVVNVGKLEECKGTVPWEKTTSFIKDDAKKLCEMLVIIRKKEGYEESCI